MIKAYLDCYWFNKELLKCQNLIYPIEDLSSLSPPDHELNDLHVNKTSPKSLGEGLNNYIICIVGIDTDKYKYPIGSGRVTFNNPHSYFKAVAAGFIEIKTAKFTKKVSTVIKFFCDFQSIV